MIKIIFDKFLLKYKNKLANRFKKNLLLVCTAVTASGFISAANAGEEVLTDAEPFIVKQQSAQTNRISDGMELSFSAYGRDFNLELTENTRLLEGVEELAKASGVTLYAGKISGVKGSWARINSSNGNFSGAVFDGEELYLIDTAASTAPILDKGVQNQIENSPTVIFRLSDLLTSDTCSTSDDIVEASSLESIIAEASDISEVTANAASQQLNVNIVADTEFVNDSNGNPEGLVLSQMNIVDGIFDGQVGVKLNIKEVTPLRNNGNLNSTNASQLLNSFRAFVGNDNPGLTHLFTGKDMDGGTIGIAFISGICLNTGVGLSEASASRGVRGALTVAHEMGHNFGAPHDNQGGSACANEPGTFLMNPFINGSNQFSACSLEQISNRVSLIQNSRANCFEAVNVDDPDEPDEPDNNPVAPIACNFTADFNNGAAAEGFAFRADAQDPDFTRASDRNNRLTIQVGGVNDDDIVNMVGAFEARCNSDIAGEATIAVTSNLTQASDYEADEASDIAVRVNGNIEALAAFRGNGNGGADQTTGEQRDTLTFPVKAGENTIELLCRNNKKTLANELTTCTFDAITSVVNEDDNGDDLLNENFNVNGGGFQFEADEEDPDFTRARLDRNLGVGNSGALVIDVGGVNNADITNMVGKATTRVNVEQSTQATLSLQANLLQSSEYEADENSTIAVIVDGQRNVINTLTGDGNGGRNQVTGFRNFNLRLNLNAGEHVISLACENNKKTFENELTRCIFDNVTLQ